MNAAIRKIGLGLCIVAVGLGSIAVASFRFEPATDSFGVGEQYDKSVETINDALRESNVEGLTFAKTREQINRKNAWFGLIVSGLMFAVGITLYSRNRKAKAAT